MLSAIPAFSFAEPGLVDPFSDFQTGLTPWDEDYSDLFSLVQSSLKLVEPNSCSDGSNTGSVGMNYGFENTNTGSDDSSAGSVRMNSGCHNPDAFNCVPRPQHDELNSEEPKNLITVATSGSEERCLNQTELNGSVSNPTGAEAVDERKRKRMESNRESAKRSRMRKQKHIENLRDQVNRLDLEKRELGNRLRLVLYHMRRVIADNNRLVTEQEILRRRLSEMRRVLIFRELQQQRARDNSNNVVTAEHSPFFVVDQML